MAVREDLFDKAMDLVYEAAGLPEMWPAALDVLAAACGGGGASVSSTLGGDGPPVCSDPIAEAMHRYVAGGWQARDLRLQRGLGLYRRGHRGLITETHLFTPEEWRRDGIRNEVALPGGFSSFGGMVVAEAGDALLPIAVEVRKGDEPYSRADIAAIDRLLARLRPAGALALRVGLRSAAMVAASLARPGEAVLLLGERGRVLSEAAPIPPPLADRVRVQAGRLVLVDAVADKALQAAIARAIARSPIGERVTGRLPIGMAADGSGGIATVIPLRGAAQDVFQLARAIAILGPSRSDRSTGTSIAEIGRLLRLSPAEARLAMRLAGGETLREIAGAEQVTFETARSRLKAIFAKTGTSRQVELAILVERLAGGPSGPPHPSGRATL